MAKATGRFRIFAQALAMLISSMLLASSPAHAQFSKSYKFLEAVRKKDGAVVQDALNEPGSQIVNTRDSTTGETALHIVTARRDLTWMSFLIGKGANVNAHDGRSTTPLQLAVTLGFPEGVDLLISQRAQIDEPNSQGETPLISAVHRRDTALVRLLLKAGANPDRADNSGRSARDYAMLNGRSSALLSEIENNAKPKGQRSASQRSYGPTIRR